MPDHFVEEWDAYLHRTCVRDFLKSAEGIVVHKHKHEVAMAFGENVVILYKEGEERPWVI